MRPASIALALATVSLTFGWQSARAAAPLEHTTRLANDDPWTSSQYQLGGGNSHQATQFGATIGNGSATPAPVASPLDRTQSAVTGTANTVRDGVEAGIKQANQQFSQAFGQTQPSTSGQFAPPPAYSSTVGAANGAPSIASTTAAPANSSGWTSIRADMAPPRLLPPSLQPLPSSNNALATSGSSAAGPSFPSSLPPLNSSTSSAANNNSGAYHSVLTGPGSDTRSSPSSSTSSSLPRVGPEVPRASSTAASETDLWNRPAPTATQSSSGFASSGDRYSQPATTAQNGTSLFPELPAPPGSAPVSSSPNGFNSPTGFSNQAAGNANNTANRFGMNQPGFGQQQPTSSGQPMGNMQTYGYGNQSGTMNGMNGQPGQEQLPWLPLLVVSLCLAGSFGANVYLGWSYADARFRYHTLVRKTTTSFHRAAAA